MNQRIIRLFIAVLLILAVMIMSGCAMPTPAKAPPVAQISVTPSTVKFGESITFSGAASADSDGDITSYEWDFGDGHTAPGETVTYTYAGVGAYNVKLTVSDNDGLSGTAEVSLKVVLSSIIVVDMVSTWRNEQPYDIYGTVKQKLEEVGFEVVSQTTDYDAILVVDYKEEQGDPYEQYPRITPEIPAPIAGYGTDITCNLRLKDKEQDLMFEINLSGAPPFPITHELSTSANSELYSYALTDFQSELYFQYLGEIIASQFGVGDEVSVLIYALEEDDDYTTRAKAAMALAKIGDASAVEPLIQALNDENADVRAEVANALGEIGDASAVEPLIQALNDENADVRAAAAKALGEIGDDSAVEPLIQALNDESKDVQVEAANALGEIGDDTAVEPLAQTRNSTKDEDVREATVQALMKIRGF